MPRLSCAIAFISRRRGFTASYPGRGGLNVIVVDCFAPDLRVHKRVMLYDLLLAGMLRIQVGVLRAFVFMSVNSALTMGTWTFPYHLAYATRVSGWCDIYIRRNGDLSDTGSPDMVDGCEFVGVCAAVPRLRATGAKKAQV